jgi:cytochrome c peroxidase
MRRSLFALLLGLVLAGAGAPGWNWPTGVAAPVVRADNPMTAAKVALGRRLFYDADLSIDGTLSCASCHEQRHGFADSVAARPGATGEPGRRNAPGLANVAWFARLTHADPAQTGLEAQVAVPLFDAHPVEMGMAGHEPELVARLGRDACYRTMFANAFTASAGRIDAEAIAKALASFERTLVSFGSAYDRGRLSPEAGAGQAVFRRACASCHSGPHFSDMAYHRLHARDPPAADRGLIEKTGEPADLGKFRTAPLRNVALSAPYWHDGSEPTLAGAVARHPIDLSPGERAQVFLFLGALTDTEFVNRKALARPDKACGRRL